MALATDKIERMPIWAWAAPLSAAALVAAKLGHLVPADAVPVLSLAAVFLFATVFAAVHHAEVVAERVGEPFGSIILAVAVTVIEVALIVSVMLSAAAGSDAIARDTVYSAVMIVLNGVVGLCLLLGGARHYEQTFQVQGASAALGVLGVLAAMALVLPNFALANPGPFYTPIQLIFVGVTSLSLYGVFVFVQTVRHLDYFLSEAGPENPARPSHRAPSNGATAASAVLLLVALTCVVLLAKTLSPALDRAVADAGLPVTVVGVVIATLVLLPEGISAIRAAHANQVQVSLNLALGSALASIGLTIPVVAVVSVVLSQPLTLGLAPKEMVLLTLTLFSSTLTLATGRTTVLQGAVHLVIFAVFLLLTFVP
jgi:Ca2+:H+ antiporter